MSMNPKEPLPGTPDTRESRTVTAPHVKDMVGRVWAVAELLAEAAHQEVRVSQSKRVSEKTQH